MCSSFGFARTCGIVTSECCIDCIGLPWSLFTHLICRQYPFAAPLLVSVSPGVHCPFGDLVYVQFFGQLILCDLHSHFFSQFRPTKRQSDAKPAEQEPGPESIGFSSRRAVLHCLPVLCRESRTFWASITVETSNLLPKFIEQWIQKKNQNITHGGVHVVVFNKKYATECANLLWIMAGGHKTSDRAKGVQLEGTQLGGLGRDLELGFKPFRKSFCHQVPARCTDRQYQCIQLSSAACAEGTWAWQRQRKREERSKAWQWSEPRYPERASFPFPEGRGVCALGCHGLGQIHAFFGFASQSICFANASQHNQREARMGRAHQESLPGSHNDARGYEAIPRKGRAGVRPHRHQESAPGHQILRQSKEAPWRSHRSTTGTSLPLDGTPFQRHQALGKSVRGLSQASGDAHRASGKGKNGDYCDQQNHPTAEQHSCRGVSTTYANNSSGARRHNRGCRRSRGRGVAETAPGCPAELCRVPWLGPDCAQAHRDHRRGRWRRWGQASQTAALLGALCCSFQDIVIGGRVNEVQRNSFHEAIMVQSIASTVEAYQEVSELTGAACSCWDEFSERCLPWTHSIMEEARYTSPFQAALNALHLQWEVFSDIYSQNSVLESFASICRPLVASQRPHSRDTVGMQVQFEDQIDVYIGDEDGLEMSCLKVAQDVIHNWCAKPWSKKRIRQKATEPPTPERDKCSIVSQEPLSSRAVLSRDSIGSQNHQKRPRVGDVDFHDTAVFMQTHLTTPAVCKNDPHSGGTKH